MCSMWWRAIFGEITAPVGHAAYWLAWSRHPARAR
jgi:hypothetical protein